MPVGDLERRVEAPKKDDAVVVAITKVRKLLDAMELLSDSGALDSEMRRKIATKVADLLLGDSSDEVLSVGDGVVVQSAVNSATALSVESSVSRTTVCEVQPEVGVLLDHFACRLSPAQRDLFQKLIGLCGGEVRTDREFQFADLVSVDVGRDRSRPAILKLIHELNTRFNRMDFPYRLGKAYGTDEWWFVVEGEEISEGESVRPGRVMRTMSPQERLIFARALELGGDDKSISFASRELMDAANIISPPALATRISKMNTKLRSYGYSYRLKKVHGADRYFWEQADTFDDKFQG